MIVVKTPEEFRRRLPEAEVRLWQSWPRRRMRGNRAHVQRDPQHEEDRLFSGPLARHAVDDLALVSALKEEWIAAAGLDVFPVEPPPSTHPIFDCKSVVMTPHTSGWSPDRQMRLIDLHVENLRRYAIGAPLLNMVDKRAGYRFLVGRHEFTPAQRMRKAGKGTRGR